MSRYHCCVVTKTLCLAGQIARATQASTSKQQLKCHLNNQPQQCILQPRMPGQERLLAEHNLLAFKLLSAHTLMYMLTACRRNELQRCSSFHYMKIYAAGRFLQSHPIGAKKHKHKLWEEGNCKLNLMEFKAILQHLVNVSRERNPP